MVKKFSIKFKQQSVDYALSYSHFFVNELTDKALFEYNEIYYNPIHRHSANGWVSPLQYEQQYYQNDKMIK
ncbi:MULTISPECIES: hypothetical protein [unclassified Gilliamella]|uniref:hypothetical protein n=1 Tax=unclassified Gilliamella TaxID=2685620 RepID=UPI001309D4D6|nr:MULTISPECIES: hypothetical protein [unclassified Gilliamella]MWP49774.1 hypothetical protein [Gilliamella sp. Lep-s35]MWP69420.1 hypothetical protein [Gilliamella sp. Lep-s5]MWP77684.1 hypothetical protein [Gilliamella sp. Lep-s21]